MTFDNYRTVAGVNLRNQDGGGTLEITFARFNEWVEIHSWREGRFLERIQPGAFADTFTERAGLIKCLFDHGHDPSIGNKPLGPVIDMRETDEGPVGVVELIDASYVSDIRAGLMSDPPVYGASYRFGVYRNQQESVVGETWDRSPGKSDHNPDGIPERSLTRLNVAEFGPVTFPADEGTTGLASVRSLDDRFDPNPNPDRILFDQAAGERAELNAKRAQNLTAFRFAQRRREVGI